MLKNAGYQEKIQMVAPWLSQIIDLIKKDLRGEHLKIDREFCKRYFLGKNPLHVTAEEMASAYEKDIALGNVGLGEFIATRWLLKNTDVYGYFLSHLKQINSDFEAIEEISTEQAEPLLQGAVKQFGSLRTYLFSVFNSVVFSPFTYAQLRELAENETSLAQSQQEEKEAAASLEALQKRHARELAALTDRFEKKLSGLQKKYLNDVEQLKRQIASLQKKLMDK